MSNESLTFSQNDEDWKSVEESSTEGIVPAATTINVKLTFKVVLAAVVSFLTNSFPSGYNMGVVNTPEAIFKQFFNQSLSNDNGTIEENQIALLWSLSVAILLAGAFIGCTFTGYLADNIGRRDLLLYNALVCLVGVGMMGMSKYIQSVPIFIAGRFIVGIHSGVGSSLVPMYLLEIAPKNFATLMGTLHVIGINSGLMVAQILGLDNLLGTADHWQLLFLIDGLIISAGLVAILFCPESMVYLWVMKQQENKAIETLKSIRGENRLELLTDDINILRLELKNRQANNTNQSFVSLILKDESFKKNLLIVCVLHAGQQLIGVSQVSKRNIII